MTGHAVDANDTSSDLMLSFFMSDILDIYIYKEAEAPTLSPLWL